MKLGILDYGCGNLKSLHNSLVYLGYEVVYVDQENIFDDFDTIILPGVGAFETAIKNLKDSGLFYDLKEIAKTKTKIIGICLGMQILMSKSYEFGEHIGLDIVKGSVQPFKESNGFKIPHMGWNNIKTNNERFLENQADYYFVHSYFVELENKEEELFKTEYGLEFTSGIYRHPNIFGVQFHPEKSQKSGLSLLKKMIEC